MLDWMHENGHVGGVLVFGFFACRRGLFRLPCPGADPSEKVMNVPVEPSAPRFLRVVLVALVSFGLGAACADAPDTASAGAAGSADVSEPAADATEDAAGHLDGVAIDDRDAVRSAAAPGLRVLGTFEGWIDPTSMEAHIEMVVGEPKAAVPGYRDNVRQNRDEGDFSNRRAGTLRFQQDDSPAVTSTDQSTCEQFWRNGWDTADWQFGSVDPVFRDGVLDEIWTGGPGAAAVASTDNRFCTEFLVRNDTGEDIEDLWILIDDFTLNDVRSYVGIAPRTVPSASEPGTFALLEPRSEFGMFNYGRMLADDGSGDGEVVRRQWMFFFGDTPLQAFRLTGRLVELLKERCDVVGDFNGDGFDNSGCGFVEAGDDCRMDADCLSDRCFGGEIRECDGDSAWSDGAGEGCRDDVFYRNGACEISAVDEPCFTSADCDADLACVGADAANLVPGACAWTIGPIGFPCDESDDCQSGYCDPWLEECRVAPGDTCVTDPECAYVHECNGGTCVLGPAFVSVWETTVTGGDSSPSNQLRLPINFPGTFDFLVDWGDGEPPTRVTAPSVDQRIRTYDVPGEYTITIRGQIEGWTFNHPHGEDRLKIQEISNWGPLRLGAAPAAGHFRGASNLTITATDVLDLTGTTLLRRTFEGCSSLTTVPSMNEWDLGAITDTSYMFQGASQFNQPIGDWNTSSVTTMAGMFDGAAAFNQPIGGWDTSQVMNMATLFQGAAAFNQPIGGWDTSSVQFMEAMFRDAESFDQPIDHDPIEGTWNTASVQNMGNMFERAAAFNRPIGNWDTGSVTNMANMFAAATSFDQPLSNWDTSLVETMAWMFRQASAFNGDISGWDTAAVTTMTRMFELATSFNQPIDHDPISGAWDVSAVTDMSSMFRAASSFNQDLPGWDVSNVQTMASMFGSSDTFNGDIDSWDVSNVENMTSMFFTNTAFNRDIGGWVPSSVQNLTWTFRGATSFNQDISAWPTNNVTTMFGTFWNATAFDQNLGAWNVESVTSMAQMFVGSGLSTASYDGILAGWATQSLGSEVPLDAGTVQYTPDGTAEQARDVLTDAFNWTITDGGPLPGGLQTSCTGDANCLSGFCDPWLEVCRRPDGASCTLDDQCPYTWFCDGGNCEELPAFITQWNTDNPWQQIFGGTDTSTGSASIRLPLVPEGNYDFLVDWGDGSVERVQAHDDPARTHTFATVGSQTVTIRGMLEGWDFEYTGDKDKLEDILQWGTFRPGPTGRAFAGATNLTTISAPDAPDLSGATTLDRMFDQAENLTAIPSVHLWDVSDVQDMEMMFRGTQFNGNLNGWDVSGVTNFGNMFANSTFNSSLAGWEPTSAVSMNQMFAFNTSFNQDIGGWDISSAINLFQMFWDATAFDQDIGGWSLHPSVNLAGMFQGAGLSTSNYDALLIGWSALPTVPANRTFDAGNAQHSPGGAAQAARNALTGIHGWTITDGGPL
ncbi:MAG: BspA family leucine-rich repeat surface protein [Deltaproteobacteria bacterium]|nr:MAG: BspA family leucine-rich repeat surface protein [Deltaproteobacteria bacterium]